MLILHMQLTCQGWDCPILLYLLSGSTGFIPSIAEATYHKLKQQVPLAKVTHESMSDDRISLGLGSFPLLFHSLLLNIVVIKPN